MSVADLLMALRAQYNESDVNTFPRLDSLMRNREGRTRVSGPSSTKQAQGAESIFTSKMR